jgi:tRNA-modifying protein YgfZ
MSAAPLAPNIAGQYEALTQGAGAVTVSDRTQVELTGADRASFLHGFCTNDIKGLTPGRGCEAFLTNVKGRAIGYVLVFCGPDSLVLETAPGQAAPIINHLDRYVIREDVQLHDRTADWGELWLSGARAEAVLRASADGVLPAGHLAHARLTLANVAVSVRRLQLPAVPAFLIQFPAPATDEIAAKLTAAGASPCDRQAWEIVRVENVWPEFGRDITDDNLPQEVGRDAAAISFTKGCYLGQETVARIDALGHVNQTLVAVKFTGEVVPAPCLELTAAGPPVGRVTSAVWSPRFAAPLALAYVRRGHNAVGTALASPLGTAEVVQLCG